MAFSHVQVLRTRKKVKCLLLLLAEWDTKQCFLCEQLLGKGWNANWLEVKTGTLDIFQKALTYC